MSTSCVVAVVSQKGGVGKTTTVLGLAGSAWDRGLYTLVVDLDPQANATAALDAGTPAFTSSDVLFDARDGIAAEAIFATGWGDSVHLLAAERALEHRAVESSGASGARLRQALWGVANRYDLVLIDCPPTLGELTRNALAAADLALVVTTASGFAHRGAAEAWTAIDVVRDSLNLRLRHAGVLLCALNAESRSQQKHLAQLRSDFGTRLLPFSVPFSEAVADAADAGIPLHAWSSHAAGGVRTAYDELLDHLLTQRAEESSRVGE